MEEPLDGADVHKMDHIPGLPDGLQDTAALPEDPARVKGPGNDDLDSPVAHGQVEGERSHPQNSYERR